MIWGWFVCRSRLVRRGGMVRFVFGVVGFTFICNISNKTVVMVSSIGHSLDTAIRKSNLVRSGDGFTYFFQINIMLVISLQLYSFLQNIYTFLTKNSNNNSVSGAFENQIGNKILTYHQQILGH